MSHLWKPATLALAIVIAGPISSQAQGVQQLLQGLTTGNQSQDRALQEAFERGYQKGRQDEARLNRNRSNGDPQGAGSGGSYNAQPPEYDNRNSGRGYNNGR